MHKSEHNVTITNFLRHNGPWNLSEQRTRRHIFWQNILFKTSVRLVSYFVYQTGNGWGHGNCNGGKILIFEYRGGILFYFPFMCFAKVVYFCWKQNRYWKLKTTCFFPSFSLIFSFFGGKIPKVCHKNKSMHMNINNSLLGSVLPISIARF